MNLFENIYKLWYDLEDVVNVASQLMLMGVLYGQTVKNNTCQALFHYFNIHFDTTFTISYQGIRLCKYLKINSLYFLTREKCDFLKVYLHVQCRMLLSRKRKGKQNHNLSAIYQCSLFNVVYSQQRSVKTGHYPSKCIRLHNFTTMWWIHALVIPISCHATLRNISNVLVQHHAKECFYFDVCLSSSFWYCDHKITNYSFFHSKSCYPAFNSLQEWKFNLF